MPMYFSFLSVEFLFLVVRKKLLPYFKYLCVEVLSINMFVRRQLAENVMRGLAVLLLD